MLPDIIGASSTKRGWRGECVQRWNPPRMHVRAWWDQLTQSIDMWGCPPALALGLQQRPISPSRPGGMLCALQPYLEPRGVLCSGDAGDPGLNQAQIDSGEEGHQGAGAVSQGPTDTGVLGDGTLCTPVQWTPTGGAGPGATCRQVNRLLHATARAVQHVCVHAGAGLCLPGPRIRADRH